MSWRRATPWWPQAAAETTVLTWVEAHLAAPDGKGDAMSETETARHWLHEFASTDDSRRETWIFAPFSIVVDGEPWTGVCNGSSAVLLREATDAPPIPAKQGADLVRWATRPGTRHEIDLAAFREWARVVEPETEPELPCEECAGVGTVGCSACGGDGLHICPDCDDEHDCGACDGEGSVECPECGPRPKAPRYKPGVLHDVIVDRRLFRPLEYLGGEHATLTIVSAEDPIVLSTPTWHLIVMPLRMERTPDMPTWPIA